MEEAGELIRSLGLQRHPEGGWFRETYRSSENIEQSALPERFTGARPCSTAIYFLLQRGDFSALHRIRSDEIWHCYAGTTVTVHVISPHGEYRSLLLGSDLPAGGAYQAVVPAGCWFGAEVTGSGTYALMGCTVSPGFDFADFEMADRTVLLQRYPEHAGVIRRLTRDPA